MGKTDMNSGGGDSPGQLLQGSARPSHPAVTPPHVLALRTHDESFGLFVGCSGCVLPGPQPNYTCHRLFSLWFAWFRWLKHRWQSSFFFFFVFFPGELFR